MLERPLGTGAHAFSQPLREFGNTAGAGSDREFQERESITASAGTTAAHSASAPGRSRPTDL